MRTIIAGNRDIFDYDSLLKAISEIDWEITEVVSGGAKGVDAMGERWAEETGKPIKKFPADWIKYGKAAGPIRNREMAKYAEALVAIWAEGSKGTTNMINQARLHGLKVHVLEYIK